jgi:hypothetical protein
MSGVNAAGLGCAVTALLGCGRIGFDERGSPGDGGADAAPAPRILFVRGGAGTVGYLNGDSDDNLCDVDDTVSARGWGTLRDELVADGFVLDQRMEGPLTAPGPADLSRLADYAVVVFGSNNATYGPGHVDTVAQYVRAGGGALFVSDAGFGRTSYAEAPASDQVFLDRFDLVMLEDANDVTTLTASQFPDPAHPVLEGVTSIRGDGTSALRIVDFVSDVTPTQIVRKTGLVRVAGATQAAAANDAAVAVAEVGTGRIAGLFDRDVLANSNANNSGIGMASNRALAINLFEWLANRR